MKFLITISLLFISICANAQSLPEKTRDSLKTKVCQIIYTDQLFRQGPLYDSIVLYAKTNNVMKLTALQALKDYQDKENFSALEEIIIQYGYPEFNLLDKTTCLLPGVLIHWSKQEPEWFNSAWLIPYFVRELKNGNMPLVRIDMAHMFYMRMNGEPDIRHKDLINNARFAYGLCPYDDGHFLTKVWIDIVKE